MIRTVEKAIESDHYRVISDRAPRETSYVSIPGYILRDRFRLMANPNGTPLEWNDENVATVVLKLVDEILPGST